MQKMRLIGTAIALLILLFTMFPIPSIVISVVCIFSYVCFTYFSKKNVVDSGTTSRRKAALYAAKLFLVIMTIYGVILNFLINTAILV